MSILSDKMEKNVSKNNKIHEERLKRIVNLEYDVGYLKKITLFLKS